ncbi:nucleotidyltransferase family protein [Melittangium boletus]|uniref:MobA-like NTP transferase domain-containing protein n=1 Tax=Melittangium boletus DSM 14713 TaxID=1294270 RepID=A0A250IFU6_9BACT|nr:nucleotidyltransferase family protein [Melittangium boletus]ATB30090.1 hypothetical protein MEBOL_003545 [Melittangium boletus DSM 14713]
MKPITIVVLAAGASTRLGHPKQLVVWRGETLVHRAARIAVESDIGPVRVVTGARGDEVARAVSDLPVTCIHNPHASEGLSSSIHRGLEGLDTNVLLLTCDQPLLTPDHLLALADTRRFTQASIIASAYEGVVGVPTLIAHELLPELRALQGDQGARALFEGRAVEPVVFDGGGLDVDTEEDILQLRERAGSLY